MYNNKFFLFFLLVKNYYIIMYNVNKYLIKSITKKIKHL